MIQILANWIGSFPGWQAENVDIGTLCQKTGSVGLFSRGIQVLEEKTDILGNRTEFCRHSFALRFRANAWTGFDTAVNFLHWVQTQNGQGLAPRLGDMPLYSRIRTGACKAEGSDGTDTVTYAVELTADYIKQYEVK